MGEKSIKRIKQVTSFILIICGMLPMRKSKKCLTAEHTFGIINVKWNQYL